MLERSASVACQTDGMNNSWLSARRWLEYGTWRTGNGVCLQFQMRNSLIYDSDDSDAYWIFEISVVSQNKNGSSELFLKMHDCPDLRLQS